MKNNIDKLATQCDTVAKLLKTIAHPQRLQILCCLCNGEKSVSELVLYTGASQSSVSQYLSKMKSEGLLTQRRDGQQIFYRIESFELKKLMQSLQKIFC